MEILTIDEVMDRYLIARRTARNLMNDAGAFIVGGKLVIRAADLLAWEDEQKAQRIPQKVPVIHSAPRRLPGSSEPDQLNPTELNGDWWKD